MAGTGNVKTVKEILDSMTKDELALVTQHIAVRHNESCPFLAVLPIELRVRIYEFVVVPEDIELHVMNRKAPALLKVSQTISAEFADVYYSRKFMKVEFYNDEKMVWEEVTDLMSLRAMLEGWPGCRIVDVQEPVPVQEARDYVLKDAAVRRSFGSGDSTRGVFSPVGGPEGMARVCWRMYKPCELWLARQRR